MDDEIDALYALPPAEFTAARDALVKRLRAEKRRDEANDVKALRRPSVAAWAVNQLARRHRDALEDVLDAGAQLASAQRRALSGIKDAGLQAAAAHRRGAIEEAWSLAADDLREIDAGAAAQRQAVVETLEAASADADAAAAVREGRLTKELAAPSDFGSVGGFALVPPPADTAPEAAADADADAAAAAAQERRRAALQAAALARGRAEHAQQRAGDARQDAVRATAEAQRLREQADKAAQRAADAARKAADATAEAEQLESAAASAAQEAEHLEEQVPDGGA